MKRLEIYALALTVFGHSVQAADLIREHNIPGTYELVICKGDCSFSNRTTVFATAVVVLFEDVMAQADQERIDPYHYDTGDVRACYVVITM